MCREWSKVTIPTTYIYSKTLKSHGFLINTYDICIENSTIKYKQYRISWYVDNNKISQDDEELNKKVIETIVEHSGKLLVSREKKHKFLRINKDFNH